MLEQSVVSLPPTSEEKNWAMLCHLAAFGGVVVPCGNLIFPLVVWLLKKDSSGFVEVHGKEVVNFQITLTAILAVCAVMYVVFIGFVFALGFGVFGVIVTVLGAIKAQNGEGYRYPMSVRLVK